MEVFCDGEDQCLILRDAFDFVAPLACDLDGRLDSFSTSVHWEDHIEAKQFGGILCKSREDIVIECSAAEGQARGLLSQGLDELGMAVALVDGAVGGEKVKVVLALWVPHAASTCAGEDYGN